MSGPHVPSEVSGKCSVVSCDRETWGHGLCNAHYQRLFILGNLNEEVPIKEQENHGLSNHPLYDIWKGILRRCTNKKCKAYPRYGGRGITVCEHWRSLENFIADMSPRPEGKSIDRIDNDGNYEPSNVRWSSAKQQANNTRSNRLHTLNGETKTLMEWCATLGINRSSVSKRVVVMGWSLEKALTVPPRRFPSTQVTE